MSRAGWDTGVPNLPMAFKTVDFDIMRRTIQERIGRDVLNTEADVREYLDYVVVRIVQRMLAKPAPDAVVQAVESTTTKTESKDAETVPANWWSHIIVAIVGTTAIPDGYGWRSWLLKKARLKDITVRNYFYITTTHKHLTKVTRVCPHVHIPEDRIHMRWVQSVDIDDGKY